MSLKLVVKRAKLVMVVQNGIQNFIIVVTNAFVNAKHLTTMI